MVLFMQKPVQYVPHPATVADKDKVWVMGQTGEVFSDYGGYLQRRDFYLQRKFTCEASGRSDLTFFDALDSELERSRAVTAMLAEPLHEPVLRKVQFSALPRIDDLVNFVFDEFVHDYFPGETVNVLIRTSETAEGVIREKTTIPERTGLDGAVLTSRRSHYFVRIDSRPGHLRETFVDRYQLSRPAGVFAKPVLRAFLKNSLAREPWPGAPWNIAQPVADRYGIETDYPAHMRRSQPTGRTEPTVPTVRADDVQAGLSNVQLAPEPVKYPIEDLELAPTGVRRPKLELWKPCEGGPGRPLRADAIGPLLEVWNLLTVYRDVFVLDPFTLDSLCDAIVSHSDSRPSELIEEIHCAVLSQLVSAEGDLLVDLPESESESESESGTGSRSESESSGPAPLTTRSGRVRGPAEPTTVLRPAELAAEFGWAGRVQAREFAGGGWEAVMAGLLAQLSADEQVGWRCEPVLEELVPVPSKPSVSAVRTAYGNLDPNLRVAALELVCGLALQTRAIRDHMDLSNERMTEFRKEKIDHQRRRKGLLEDLREIDDQRRLVRAEIAELTVVAAFLTPVAMTTATATTATTAEPGSGPEDKKRKRDDSKLAKPEAALRKLDSQAEKKMAVVREAEVAIAALDDRLRQANIQRTRFLGRDRFWNKYYWFERNGMPEAPSTAGYLNGRIWVQGPDESEADGFLRLTESESAEYVHRFGRDIPARRAEEENGTVLAGPTDWGFFSNPDDLDVLIDDWLDDRGVREKSLTKELRVWRDSIAAGMRALRRHQASRRGGEDEGVVGESVEAAAAETAETTTTGPPATRSSARLRSATAQAEQQQQQQQQASEPEPEWTNNAARALLGRLHSEPKGRKAGGKKAAKPTSTKVKAKTGTR